MTNWQVSPGGAMMEERCCRALCRLFGLFPNSDATFMYSGTYANQEALYLALKEEKKQLEKPGQLNKKAREEISRKFGRLLSYPEDKIEEKLSRDTPPTPFMLDLN